MATIIKDGTGTGQTVSVTKNNRLMTAGANLTLTELATETGDSYNLNTGTIALSSTNESALLYIKNQEDGDLLVDAIIVNIKDFVGTNGQPTLKVYRNATAGTLISNATSAIQSNRNYGSSKTLASDIYQGVEGDTISGQDAIVEIFLPTTAAITLNILSTLVILPKGATLGISYTPPSGMTSTNIVVAFNATLNGSQL